MSDTIEEGYAVAPLEAVPVTDMADVEAVPEQFDPLDVRDVDEALGTAALKPKVWTVPAGAYMGAHGHPTQEEVYLVLAGRFEVRIGPPGEEETREAGPGTLFRAAPHVARGYENVGEGPGRVLVVAAPNVEERGIPAAELGDDGNGNG